MLKFTQILPGKPDAAEESAAKSKAAVEPHALDALTGGAFSAATSGERAQRVRAWLASEPTAEQMAEVFKELSARDKGAAKPLKERLDEIKRSKSQDAMAAEWAAKAQALLDNPKTRIAEALAWQRDAARAGAALSKPPLAELRTALQARADGLSALEHQLQVQREAAMLLAQRCDILSTKPWRDAQSAADALRTDVKAWDATLARLKASEFWAGIDPKYPALMEAAQSQVSAVWEAFDAALASAAAAHEDANAPLPSVPVWADELRQARLGAAAKAAEPGETDKPAKSKPKLSDEQREASVNLVRTALQALVTELDAGHTKGIGRLAGTLREALKAHGKRVPAALEAEAHGALARAGELEGWNRWRADQLREELIAKVAALLPEEERLTSRPVVKVKKAQPAARQTTETTQASPTAQPIEATPESSQETGSTKASDLPEAAESLSAAEPVAATEAALESAEEVSDAKTPAKSNKVTSDRNLPNGRKLQEALRQLREQWRAIDQGGAPNHTLWKRFDELCNKAHARVEAWIDQVKAEESKVREKRQALIDEVKAWSKANASNTDFKMQARELHRFSQRWREAGHMGEKAFDALQTLWKQAIGAAHAPLEAAQKASIERRRQMIAQALELGAAPTLRIDAVRALQQAWQAEAQSVPLERKLEQKLWEQFRKPIDDAFQRKTQERETAAAAVSARDKAVIDAAKAVDAAIADGDAAKIREAMAALERLTQGRDDPQQAAQTSTETSHASAASKDETAHAVNQAPTAARTSEPVSLADSGQSSGDPVEAPAAAKPIVARRGDDRPGAKQNLAPASGRDVRGGPAGRGKPEERRGPTGGDRRGSGRPDFKRNADGPRAPRLGDTAFRAQREAIERAQSHLRKLASLAHGEALVGLLSAWEKRDAQALPEASALGKSVQNAMRQAWSRALNQAPSGDASEAILRLEIAAEVPTPAAQHEARRAYQLKLLTMRGQATPRETWAHDLQVVLESAHDEATAKRLQAALKSLLK